jgi:hypothetical protein
MTNTLAYCIRITVTWIKRLMRMPQILVENLDTIFDKKTRPVMRLLKMTLLIMTTLITLYGGDIT